MNVFCIALLNAQTENKEHFKDLFIANSSLFYDANSAIKHIKTWYFSRTFLILTNI